MLTVPWIINNMMISEPNKIVKLRRPSEIEMKVQKSLQKLTVPDWYTNKSRASPKIITDRRPIESRPAPWKNNNPRNRPLLLNDNNNNNNNQRKNANMTNTAVVRPIVDVDDNDEDEDYYKLSKSEFEKLQKKLRKNCFEIKGGDRSSQIRVSETFPKISPSRKIQNINIVFPRSASASASASIKAEKSKIEIVEPVKKLAALRLDKSEMSVDSLLDEEESSPRKINSTIKNDRISILNGNEYPLNNPTARILNFNDSPCGKSEKKNKIFRSSDAVASLSDSRKTIVRNNSVGDKKNNYCRQDAELGGKNNIEILLTPSKYYNNNYSNKKISKIIPSSSSSASSSSVGGRGGFGSMFGEKKLNKETIIISKSTETSFCNEDNFSYDNKNFFDRSTKREKEEEEEEIFASLTTTNEKLFSTPRKSTEMENIIKNSQSKRSSGKSFVEEIIEELNAKCSPKIKKSNYVSPSSKNFVKKLVLALETGFPAPKNKNNNEESNFENFYNLKTNSSEVVYSSSGSSSSSTTTTSTTTSIKDSDSGSGSDDNNCELNKGSSSRFSNCSSPFRSFSRALEDREPIESRDSVTPYVDEEDESVFWIPLPKACKLPRTSSLKNMMSRISSPGSASAPESIASSIGSKNFESSCSGWGKTFDKSQQQQQQSRRSRQLFRIDETTVVDSGYSDRSSGTNSSRSSSVIDEYYFNDYSEDITNTTPVRNTDESYNGYSNDNDNDDNNSLQRTFDITMLRCRQRTSVV